MNEFIFDTETTGLDPEKSYVIQLGVIMRAYDLDGKIPTRYAEFNTLVNWFKLIKGFKIPARTIAVHGITNEELDQDKYPDPYEAFGNLYDFVQGFISESCKLDGQQVPDDKSYLNTIMAFNLAFDQNMMISNMSGLSDYNQGKKVFSDATELDYTESTQKVNNLLDMFRRNVRNKSKNHVKFLDPMLLDRIFRPDVDNKIANHSLHGVGKYYGLADDENAHDALSDTRRLVKIWEAQIEDIKEKAGIDVYADASDIERRCEQRSRCNAKYYDHPNDLAWDYFGKQMNPVNI